MRRTRNATRTRSGRRRPTHLYPPRRRKNPAPGTLPVVLGVLAVGLIGGGIYAASKKPAPKPKAKGCAPYKYDELAVRAAIDKRIDQGMRDPMEIAMDVASDLFGQHPSGVTVTFPPGPSAPKGVQCVWEKVVALVARIFDERGISGDEYQPIDFDIHDPNDEGYPWETPTLPPENYPTPGMFMDPADSQSFDYSRGVFAITGAVLNSAIAMAASRGYDVSTAQNIMAQDAAKSSKKRDLQKQMVDVMFGQSKFNDGLFNRQVSADKRTSAENLYGWTCNGRSPLFLPQHNDVLGQLSLGQKPKRAIRLNGAHISGQNRRQPQFWAPAVDLSALAGPKPVVRAMRWSDGSSTAEPPPIVQRKGIDLSGVAMPGGLGCK